jgi:hypothetical protein
VDVRIVLIPGHVQDWTREDGIFLEFYRLPATARRVIV